MAKTPPIYGAAAANLFSGITPSSTSAPLATYSLTTFTYLRPDWRVKFGVTSLTLTWNGVNSTIPGDLFALPMSNATSATLTNSSGLSQAITFPSLPADSLPLTPVVDLSGASLASRKAGTWSLALSGASSLTLGGAVVVYGPKTSFLGVMAGDHIKLGFHRRESHGVVEKKNEFLSRFMLDMQTRERAIDCILQPGSDSGVATILDWFRANHGGALPSLFWPDPTVNDAYFGTWQTQLDELYEVPNYRPITLTFTELSKGIPLL